MLLIYTGNINVYLILKKYIVHNYRPQSRDKTIHMPFHPSSLSLYTSITVLSI